MAMPAWSAYLRVPSTIYTEDPDFGCTLVFQQATCTLEVVGKDGGRQECDLTGPTTNYLGTTDSAIFEDFIGQLLQHCKPFPGRNSVIIMDNASFHYFERIDQMCNAAGVKRLYLAPYSPRLNPIEEFFAAVNLGPDRNGSSRASPRYENGMLSDHRMAMMFGGEPTTPV